MTHVSLRFARVLFATLLVSGCVTLGEVANMDATQIREVDTDKLCRASALIRIGHQQGNVMNLSSATIDAEIARRNASCAAQDRQMQVQYGPRPGPALTNNSSPECRGISVTRAGVGNPFGGVVGQALPVLYVTLANATGQRRSVMLDIKIYTEGRQNAYVTIPSGEHWQSGGPYILRADEPTGSFMIKADQGPNDRITAVSVLSCGG